LFGVLFLSLLVFVYFANSDWKFIATFLLAAVLNVQHALMRFIQFVYVIHFLIVLNKAFLDVEDNAFLRNDLLLADLVFTWQESALL